MATYYISNSGDDTNSGISKAKPWKTIERLSSVVLRGGDFVRLKKGDTFYGVFEGIVQKEDTGAEGTKVKFCSYGVGEKPVITAAKIVKPQAWLNHAGNVWKVQINDANNITGFTSRVGATGANIGFLRTDGIIRGFKKFQISDLTAQWQFYSDTSGGWLYVYSTGNPSTLASEIKAVPDGNFVRNLSGTAWIGLKFKDIGGHGFSSSPNDLDIIGCTIEGIGGSVLIGHSVGTTRYGNAVEMWIGSKRVLVSNCTISDVYDTATTMQGYGVQSLATSWEDVVLIKNKIVRCTQAFEIWATYNEANTQPTPAGTGFFRCRFDHNEVIDSGYGWGGIVRPDTWVNCPILLYGVRTAVTDISCQHNVIVGFDKALIYRSENDPSLPTGYIFENNVIVFDDANKKIHTSYTYTAKQWSVFTDATGLGRNCSIHALDDAADTKTIIENAYAFIASSLGKSNLDYAASCDAIVEAYSSESYQSATSVIETLSVENINNTLWAPILEVSITDKFRRFDAVFSYATGGDSDINRGGIGFLNLQFVPNMASNGLAYCGVDNLPLMFGTNLPTNMFCAVVTQADTTVTRIRVFVNIGRDNYLKMQLTPMSIINREDGLSYTLINRGTLVTLPAGTTTYSSVTNAASAFAALTGNGPPSILPPRVGSTYLDLTNKKEYRAFGVSNASDWVILN